ncbi:hypothetical protein V3C07_10335 [Phocaeicola vulgatus]|jgi:hypothetical protein|uniref:hypothetical protein n=1 Tax=Phocaeicola vulgatus TaxID=821 RepID=UPI001C391485|nr:hypothetical protein [Phocaeicola vulgatus]MBV4207725.1 hypothetical protein [Phocaeicola vulgatus]
MSDLNLENIVGFKAVDKNGNERQVTVDEMTELVSARIVSAASEISTFAAAAAAGTDEFEDQLPQSDTFSWLRTLDGSKNPTLTSSSAAAKVLGELIGINDLKRDATIARNSAGANDSYYYNIIPSNVVKCSYLVEILEDRSQPKIYIVSKYYSNYKNDYNVKGVVVGSSMLSVKFFYNDNGDIILSIVASTRSSLVSVKLLCGDSMPSITKIETPSGLTEIPIS